MYGFVPNSMCYFCGKSMAALLQVDGGVSLDVELAVY